MARRTVIMAAFAATYLQAVCISLPNAAVLHIEGALSMADDEIGWVFSAYIAASAVTMPMTRPLAGRFGRKALFQACLVVFAIGLWLATQAVTPLQFVGARVIEGAASGPLAPLAGAILLERMGPRAGLWSTVMVLLGILSGPAIGGWISEYHGWHTMFWLALAATLAIGAAMTAGLDEQRPAQPPAFDWFGLGTLSLGLVGLQMLLDRGERMEWFASIESGVEAAASALGFWLFAVHVATSKRHFADRALFRDRNFALSTALFFAFGFVLLPTLALTSPMLEELLGYPPETTGLMTIPRGAALIGAFILASRMPGWIDQRLVVIGAIALAAWGTWLMLGYSPLMDWWPVVRAGAVQGAGLGVLMAALGRAAFGTLDPALRAEGTAVFNLARLYGSTLGIATVQIFFFDNTQAMHLALAAHVTAGPHLAALNEMVTGQAALIAVIDQFALLLAVLLIAGPLALLLRQPKA